MSTHRAMSVMGTVGLNGGDAEPAPEQTEFMQPEYGMKDIFPDPNAVFSREAFAAYVTEFLGTFLLVWCMTILIKLENNPLGPLTYGSMYLILVYLGGHVSGGHYNPAVTLAVSMSAPYTWGGQARGFTAITYIIMQMCGSICGGFLGLGLNPANTQVGVLSMVPATDMMDPTLAGFLLEMSFTFLLVVTMSATTTRRKTGTNMYYGLAAGAVLVAAGVADGPLTGAALNPAVPLGIVVPSLVIVDGVSTKYMWVCIVGSLVGGILAGLAAPLLNPDINSTDRLRCNGICCEPEPETPRSEARGYMSQ